MTAAVCLQLAGVGETAVRAQATGLHWLTDAEHHRLQAMGAQARRDSYIAGHWLARQAAAQWLQLDATRIALAQQPDGRPLLCVDGAVNTLQVSLSHSGNWLAIALADVAVGIDVELPHRPRDLDALARFVCSAEELQRLQALSLDQQRLAFHTVWTLKEARGKCSGEGLLPHRARLLGTRPCAGDVAEAMSWAFHGGALALAIETGISEPVVMGAAVGAPAYWRYVASG